MRRNALKRYPSPPAESDNDLCETDSTFTDSDDSEDTDNSDMEMMEKDGNIREYNCSLYEADSTCVDSVASVDAYSLNTEKMHMDSILGGGGRPPEYYLSRIKEVNESTVSNTSYSIATLLQHGRIRKQWWIYCSLVGLHPVHTLDSISRGHITSFFEWKLSQTRGENNRKLRGTTTESSLKLYWKQFRLMRKGEVNTPMHENTISGMREELRKLAKQFKLSRTPREKPSMDVFDVRELLGTTITTTEKLFKVGRYRIQLCFFVQGGFITANRPDALLKLQYKHIAVSVLRDPLGGPHKILLELTYEFTKTFLGPKAPYVAPHTSENPLHMDPTDNIRNTFPIPEIIFDPTLIISPHVFLLGLMFADKAFMPANLTPEDLLRLDIRPGTSQLTIPINPWLADTYVFRKCNSSPTLTGWTISTNRLPDSTIRPQMKAMGEITGFKQVAKPYCLRYGAANAFEKDGSITADLRNLMMVHGDTRTFVNHYLSRRIIVDTQAIVRGLAPQDEIMRAACRMSRWIDPERPRKLNASQLKLIDNHPKMKQLRQWRAERKGKAMQENEYMMLGEEITKERRRLKDELIRKVRDAWDNERAKKDIQLQLSGQKFGSRVRTVLDGTPGRTPLHSQLVKAILSPPRPSLEEEVLRRSAAIIAIVAYCGVQEGETRGFQLRKDSTRPVQTVSNPSEEDLSLEAAKVAVFSEWRPKICFICLGTEGKPLGERIKSYYSPGVLSRHFNGHLRDLKDGDGCNLCGITFNNKMHCQRHALEKHGTVSDVNGYKTRSQKKRRHPTRTDPVRGVREGGGAGAGKNCTRGR